MDYYAMTDKGIAAEIGSRLKALRLRKNLTQQQLAERTVLSVTAIKSLESGKGRLSTLIIVLRELNALDSLDSFIPELPISPLQIVKLRGKIRKRATGSRGKHALQKKESEW